MLVLFDIDSTLINTNRAGRLAMADAGQALFSPPFNHESVAFAGRLDPQIIADLLLANRAEPTPEAISAFRAAYRSALEHRLQTPAASKILPGVTPLLATLEQTPSITLGLLTGNYPETAKLKLLAAGIDPARFPIQAFGNDSPHNPPSRDDLPQIAINNWRTYSSKIIPEPPPVTIVGDTPHDIRCALHNNCLAIAVATGPFTTQELKETGAHLTLDTLEDTETITQWITNHP